MVQRDSQLDPIVVVGDGWAATAVVGFLATQHGTSGTPRRIHWIAGSGARVFAPLPTLEAGAGADAWRLLTTRLGIETGDAQPGSFLREFRNKSFREPAWAHAMELFARQEIMNECLQPCELQIPPKQEVRFDRPLREIEAMVREALFAGAEVRFERTEGVPFEGIKVEEGRVTAAILGSGQEIACSRLIYADRWVNLGALAGMPKGLSFLRKHEPVGVLQAVFTHQQPMGLGLREGFFSPLHREAGEESEKHLFGYFSSDGMRSSWSLCIPGEEAEDNHSIAKRLRRMKSALDKMFVGPEWLPAHAKDFLSTVESEQIRFEENVLLSGGDAVTEPVKLGKLQGLSFLTDGYGPAQAFQQAAIEAEAFGQTSPESAREDVATTASP